MSKIELEFIVKNEVSKNIKLIEGDLNRLKVTNQNTAKSFSLISRSMIALTGSAYALSKAYDGTIKGGLEYNNLLENQRNSIATLINVTSKNVDSQGNQLKFQDKMNLSLKNSNELMAELTKVNANTPQTLGQTAQIFRTMYAPMQKIGASQKDMIFLTEKLAIASKVGGVQFQSLLAGVDGLASGTVLANSDLGRFLSSIGLTNEKIKKSDNVVKTLKNSLKDFKAFDDMDTDLSNVNVQLDTLTGTLTKPLFETAKESAKGFASVLLQINRGLKIWNAESTDVTAIDEETLKIQRKYLISQKEIIKNDKFMWDSTQKTKIKEIDKALLEVSKRMTSIFTAKENPLESNSNKSLIVAGSNVSDFGTSLSNWQSYYETIKDYKTGWIIAEQQLNSKYADLTTEQYEKLLQITKAEYFDKFNNSETGQNDPLIINYKLENIGDFEQEFQEIERKLFDALEPFELKIDLDTSSFEGVSADLIKMSKSVQSLVDEQKEFNKYSKEYKKIINPIQSEIKKFNKIESQHTQNQLAGYSNLAGQFKNTFEEGSSGAEAMIVVQKGLAIATAGVAIAKAGTSDPYTSVANVIAMIAALKSGGVSAGGSGGGGSSVPTYESNIESANYGTDSIARNNVSLANYGGNFDKFTEGLDSASDKLRDFGNEGTAQSSETQTILSEISKAKINILDAQERANIGYGSAFGYEDMGEFWEAVVFNRNAIADIAINNNNINSLNQRLEENISEILQESLDFSDFSITQLQSLTSDFNATAFATSEENLREYALAIKDGGDISQYTALVANELSKSNYQLGLDYEEAIEILEDYNEGIANTKQGLEERLALLKATDEVDKLALQRLYERNDLISDENKLLLDSIFEEEDRQTALMNSETALKDATTQAEAFNKSMETVANGLKNAINTISGNSFTAGTQDNTNDLIKQYNQAVNKEDYTLASNLATTISNGSFGDSSLLNSNLIDDLQQNLLNIGLGDEIINVNIVGSDITTAIPTVTVANGASNETLEKKLDDVIDLLSELLANRTTDLTIQREFQQVGISISQG